MLLHWNMLNYMFIKISLKWEIFVCWDILRDFFRTHHSITNTNIHSYTWSHTDTNCSEESKENEKKKPFHTFMLLHTHTHSSGRYYIVTVYVRICVPCSYYCYCCFCTIHVPNVRINSSYSDTNKYRLPFEQEFVVACFIWT